MSHSSAAALPASIEITTTTTSSSSSTTSPPLPPSHPPDVHLHLSSSTHERLLHLWSDLSSLPPPQRDAALHRLCPSQADEALAHLQLLSSLLPLKPPPSSSPPPASTSSPSPLTTGLYSPYPVDLSGKTQPAAGEAPKPTPDSARWGETVVVPFGAYRSSHSSLSPLLLLPYWWCASVWRPLSDRTVNHCRLHTPVGFIGRLAGPVKKTGVEGAKATSWWNALWTWVGVFTALACVSILHQYYTNSRYDWPMLFASHGALVTIIFCTPGNTVVQPYHTFIGTLIGTFYPVLIAHHMDTTTLLWLAVALSSAAAITTMQLLGCVHPPAGALSVLYLAVPTVQVLGYWYIIAGEVGALIIYLVALIVNNLPRLEARQFPTTWLA